MRIIGIDPGSRTTGYGLIDCDGPRVQVVRWGCITSRANRPLPDRLLRLYESLAAIFSEAQPQVTAVENVFHAHYARSALILGHARGVALLAAAQAGVEVVTYSPLEVKQAVIGYGRGEKTQVQAMVTTLLHLEKTPPTDAADALAVALCHAHSAAMRSKLEAAKAPQARASLRKPPAARRSSLSRG